MIWDCLEEKKKRKNQRKEMEENRKDRNHLNKNNDLKITKKNNK